MLRTRCSSRGRSARKSSGRSTPKRSRRRPGWATWQWNGASSPRPSSGSPAATRSPLGSLGPDHKHTALALANQGRAAQSAGASERAIDLLEQAVDTFTRAAPWDPIRSGILLELAGARLEVGQSVAALATANEGVAVAQANGDPDGYARALSRRGQLRRRAGKRDAADADVRHAIELLEAQGAKHAAAIEELRERLEP